MARCPQRAVLEYFDDGARHLRREAAAGPRAQQHWLPVQSLTPRTRRVALCKGGSGNGDTNAVGKV